MSVFHYFLRFVRLFWSLIQYCPAVRTWKRPILQRRSPSGRWRMKTTSWHKSLITVTKDRVNSLRWNGLIFWSRPNWTCKLIISRCSIFVAQERELWTSKSVGTESKKVFFSLIHFVIFQFLPAKFALSHVVSPHKACHIMRYVISDIMISLILKSRWMTDLSLSHIFMQCINNKHSL